MFSKIIQEVLNKRELYKKALQKSEAYMFGSFGKRIRSILFYMCGGDNDNPKYHETIAIIEDMHNAALIHDDIIDNNKVRRNKESEYGKHGTKLSILLGDHLLIKAVGRFMEIHGSSAYIRRSFIRECEATSYGAIMEQNLNNRDCIDINNYIRMASLKTAPLFKLCCFLGAFLSGKSFEESKKLAMGGLCFGIIFQIQNDLDSYAPEKFSDSEDYTEKNISFPIVLMHDYLNYDIQLFKTRTNQDEYDFIRETINSQGGKNVSLGIAKKYIDKWELMLN